jgi:superfamily II DNA/RNA helicase
MADITLADTIESFGTGASQVRLLLATDVASEGVNLHHQCHHIIHYDLPWSIITLIQRNGRIDRFGQRHSPVVRYLMIRTRQGFLDGDGAIFERLVEKVEEINRSTRTGESVLKLYDAKKEEEYIATGHSGRRHGRAGRDQPEPTSASWRSPARRHRPGPRRLAGLAHRPGRPPQVPMARQTRSSTTPHPPHVPRRLPGAGLPDLSDLSASRGDDATHPRPRPRLSSTRRQNCVAAQRASGNGPGAEVIFGATAIPEAGPRTAISISPPTQRGWARHQGRPGPKGQWSRGCCSPSSTRAAVALQRLMMLMRAARRR